MVFICGSTKEFGEGNNIAHKKTSINCLIIYNAYRTWPINTGTVSGELDKETITLLFSKRLLSSKGLIDDTGKVIIDITRDRFYVDGNMYVSSGDSASSQAGNQDALYMIILKRLGSERLTDLKIIE